MLKIATYKDFKRIDKLEKSIKRLESQDFSQVKKLSNLPYLRVKVNYEDRILFTFFRYQGQSYILLLEHIKNHEYQKSKFLRGKKWDEEDFEFSNEEIEEVIFVNDKQEFTYFDKFISFSNEQESIVNLNPPIILIGSAGSGKTSILLEKLQTFDGKVLYISLSKNLVEHSKKICNSTNDIDFLTFAQLFDIKNEITFEIFKTFAIRYGIKEVEKYFEEFRGVITANFETPYLLKAEYLDLSIRNSLFVEEEREEVYDKFEKYLAFLKSQNFVDSNIETLQLSRIYDYVVIDEVQDFTNAQIATILNYGKNFILAGDANQIIYSNFFSWSKLKTMLYKSDEYSQISLLRENYRNSKAITNISNNLLKIKQLRFGSIDKESNYLIETVSKRDGEIFFWTNSKMEQELNEKRKDDVTFAVIVFDEESKQKAIDTFDTPLIFTVYEAKGLEYKNIILFNFVSNESKKFFDIVSSIEKPALEKELKYSRPKDKTDRELDIYKIYINVLYVAFTRGVENLYIIEKDKHKLWEILGVVESKQKQILQVVSKEDEWLKESKKLEEFGRVEQVKKIHKKLEVKSTNIVIPKKKPTKVKPGLNYYKKLIFEDNKITKSNKDKLFKLAKSENNLDVIRDMAEQLDFKSAKVYLNNLGEKSLKTAIANRDVTLLKNSLVNGVSVKNMNIYTLVKNNADIEFLKVLLDNGADVDSEDKHTNVTALMIASQNGYIKIVKLLIESGANIDFITQNRLNALKIASQNGHIRIVEMFINYGANLNIQNRLGVNALMTASQKGYIKIVKLLIDNGANLDLVDNRGFSALISSLVDEHKNIAKLLIKSGINLDIQSLIGETALMFASAKGYQEITELLLEKGANLHLKDKEGWTALMWAVQGGYIEIVKILINKSGNDINTPTKDGDTPLTKASQNGHIEIVKFLIEQGANIDFQDNTGVSALLWASQKLYTKIVKLLIENDANLDLQNHLGATALIYAVQDGHLTISKLLIENGANLNLQTFSGETALMLASGLGHIKIAKLLIENGVNIHLKNNKGYTALDIADSQEIKNLIRRQIDKATL